MPDTTRERLVLIDRALWVDHGDGNLDGLTGELPPWADEWAAGIVEAVNGRAELLAALDESRGYAGRAHGQAGALLARTVELRAQVAARDARVAELEAQRDRITDLFEKWAAEENEHLLAGELGIAEGLHVAIEMLRLAVHGTHTPSYPPGDEPTHPRTAGGGR